MKAGSRILAGLMALGMVVPGGAWAAKAKAPTTLTVDLPGAYTEVLEAVTEVAGNGRISGSAEYEKDKSIAGAQAGDAAGLFSPWTGVGKVVYKMRAGALAPSHFLESNDNGAVAVRYVVQEVNPATTRLVIDAVFVEEAHRRRHASDGAVEAAEFAEVQKQLRITEQHRLEARRQREAEELAQMEDAAAFEKKDLEKLMAEVAALEQRAQGLRRESLGRVKSATELKSAPYAKASSLGALAQGETLDVLSSTAQWCHVRDQQGHEGWIAYSLLEALP